MAYFRRNRRFKTKWCLSGTKSPWELSQVATYREFYTLNKLNCIVATNKMFLTEVITKTRKQLSYIEWEKNLTEARMSKQKHEELHRLRNLYERKKAIYQENQVSLNFAGCI